MTRIALLSTSDTDLLSARAAGPDFALGNPSRLDVEADLPGVIEGADLVVVRILGSARSWQAGLDTVLAAGVPVVVLGGEQTPDAELMGHSTVPVGTAAEAHAYLAQGGPANLTNLHAFLSDTVLLTGEGFEAPQVVPEWGWSERPSTPPPVEETSASTPPPVEETSASARPLVEETSASTRPLVEEVALQPSRNQGSLGFETGAERLPQPAGQTGAERLPQPAGQTGAERLPQPAGQTGAERLGLDTPPRSSAALDHRNANRGQRARVGVLYYRAHEASGNNAFAHALADAIDATGEAVGLPIFSSSLRAAPDELYAALGSLDAVIVTVLAAGGTTPGTASAGEDDEAWDVERMKALDIPVLQGLCLTSSRAEWEESDDGVTPLDSANQIAIPEFDGRIITAPFSFKEIDEDGLPRYVADEERCARVAGIAVNHARLRHIEPKDRRLALMLSAYPTKHSRIGNAVGLDTPVSTIRLLRKLRDAGYDLGAPTVEPAFDVHELLAMEDDTAAGNALIHALIAAGGQDEEWLTSAQLDESHVRIPKQDYENWTADLPKELKDEIVEAWGAAPGTLFVNDQQEIVLATLRAGNVVLMIQPPRGFGENPVAIYHDPELAPSHHYLAAYRWVEKGFRAHAVVHLGKHGSMEWLPGKNAALAATCATDAVIGNLPLIYPFLINDPGEGAQAKRRAHATIVDHLIPPMARAESYGDIAKLEQLLDEYANIAAMDPPKLPMIRAQIWTLMQTAQMHKDLGLEAQPGDEEFDDFIMHVDGWLCEVKDAQIRDGLHILGQAPEGEARVNLVLAILRATQIWGGTQASLPGLRHALGLKEDAPSTEVDAIETRAKALVQGMEDADWQPDAVARVIAQHESESAPEVAAILDFAATQVVPRLARTTDELDAVLHALEGGFIPAGPSGSPLRGLVNVLPTGRNFYTVDPRAVPSRLAWETGVSMAESLVQRYLTETGEYPRSVGLSVWGTSAMRTSGDDIAEVLALIGIRPEWDPASRRVNGLTVIPLDELGRPRVDVTVRISGFFRDAFPHVIAMLDDAIRMAAELDEPLDQNFVRAHAQADLAEHGDVRRSTTRIFGSRPGAYGAGILQVIESGNWRDDKDLAEVYTQWGGFAYGRGLDGAPAADAMRANYRRINVAAKNIDTREHDIADSDDYFQYHGGMIATVRALTGNTPRAYVGDSTTPDAVRTRTLAEETARVFRARVVNPRWIGAMQRHGYKGAFELAATVDYLFGFDATAGVVHDWMYDALAREYVLDETNQEFMKDANPWALRGIIERLHEAAERDLWAEPDPEVIAAMQQVYLDLEGELEDRG